MSSTKNIISGAAIGTALGCLAAFLYPRRHELLDRLQESSATLNQLGEKAREYGETLFDKGRHLRLRKVEYRDRYLTGGLFGLTIGAITALLVAPKTGKALRRQLAQTYHDFSDKSEHIIHQFRNNSHPAQKAKGRRLKVEGRRQKAES
jgi:gas vesicle protein